VQFAGGGGRGGRGGGGRGGRGQNGDLDAPPAAQAPAAAPEKDASRGAAPAAPAGKSQAREAASQPQASRSGAPSGDAAGSAERRRRFEGGGDRGSGGGRGNFGGGFGGGGFGGRGPGGNERMLERFKEMSADEQKQFLARLKDRGADTSAFESAMKAGASKPAAAKAGATTPQGAETIDALFAPLPPVESRGRVWLYTNDKQLKPLNVRLGITDGTQTELLGGEVQPGTEVVTSVLTGQVRPATGGNQQNNGNPLLPGNNRGNFQGGGNRGRGF
jgi:hypothetical protein